MNQKSNIRIWRTKLSKWIVRSFNLISYLTHIGIKSYLLVKIDYILSTLVNHFRRNNSNPLIYTLVR